MKTISIIFALLKWIIILFVLLIALATFMGGAYLQTIFLIILVLSLAWWPKYFRNKWNKRTSLLIRTLVVLVSVILGFVVFGTGPKTSIYLSEEQEAKLMNIYDEKVQEWPADTEDIYIETEYGIVHLLACGSKENPPLMMIHAASMGAHSWAENLEPLLDHYRIYSIDNIGEGNKSKLFDVLVYPQSEKEIADLYASLADSLGIDSSVVFGASNGGFVALSYAYHYPKRVQSLALFGPMGLTQLTAKSIMMLSIASLYPFDFVKDYVANWALGDDEYVNQKYGDWFYCILESTIPSVAMPVPLTKEQKKEMEMPVLLFLGTNDAIVGDAETAAETASEYPDIQIEVLESGHIVAVEKREVVNRKVKEFLGIDTGTGMD
jgi:pimeloyl-ACP methyl ester carboxylesterase